jgi:hypothetical protein
MKKLLLLSALLIFACSSDGSNDDNDNNNNSSTKKLASVVTLYPCSWCERENSYLSYTNDRLTLVEKDYFVTEENGDFMNGGEDNSSGYFIIEYLSNSIRITNNNGEINDIPVNSDGSWDNENAVYDNGYLISLSFSEEEEEDTDSSTGNWEWYNGNLIRTESNNYYNGSLESSTITDIEYTEYDDLTKTIAFSAFEDSLGWADVVMIGILGFYGKSSAKLPYKFTSVQNSIGSDEFTSVLTYSYVFDEDGYPIQVVANYESSSGFSRTTRYELTYTN